ncbi:MAG: caspase family protein [Opitutaceae bacterium]|nr:caspase family protein [Cytophagales bacterium]
MNTTLAQTYSAIKRYGAWQYADGDQLFVFIAGHGEYDPVFKEGYLVAADTKKDDDARVTYLSHSNMRTMLNNIPCQHIFLTLDACFGGTFDQEASSRGGNDQYTGIGKDEYIKRKMKYKTRLYLTSGGKEYVPDGRPGQHSPFARKLLEGLRSSGGEDGILSYSELLGFVEKVTPEPRKGEFGDNQPGSDFLFIRK